MWRQSAHPCPPQCCVCPCTGGALKPTTVPGAWCHSACQQWIPEVGWAGEEAAWLRQAAFSDDVVESRKRRTTCMRICAAWTSTFHTLDPFHPDPHRSRCWMCGAQPSQPSPCPPSQPNLLSSLSAPHTTLLRAQGRPPCPPRPTPTDHGGGCAPPGAGGLLSHPQGPVGPGVLRVPAAHGRQDPVLLQRLLYRVPPALRATSG